MGKSNAKNQKGKTKTENKLKNGEKKSNKKPKIKKWKIIKQKSDKNIKPECHLSSHEEF